MAVGKWELCPPEVWGAINDMVVWFKEHGLSYETIVYNSDIHKYLVPQGMKLYTAQYHIFTDYPEALQWAREMVKELYENKPR
ncbi:hypothetical protein L4C34_15365 [Vibrio profundum]|uniref:hypothetical protein n=1 Tax=Vibrio profundum TaxID=2910247 RepID=UPI003D0CA324